MSFRTRHRRSGFDLDCLKACDEAKVEALNEFVTAVIESYEEPSGSPARDCGP